MKITTKMVKAAYSYAKDVYENRISKKDALGILVEDFGMNLGSATDFVHNFKHMMEGERYTRTNNGETTEYYLNNIRSDYGLPALENALSAVGQHIDYYNSLGNGKLRNTRKIYNKHKSILNNDIQNIFPDEILNPDGIYEGAKKEVIVNLYERNLKARKQCIEHYGARCSVCNLDFEDKYGEIGTGFIHVHHLVALSAASKTRKVDPIKDLRPVCPNCHAMLHRGKPTYTIEQLKEILISE